MKWYEYTLIAVVVALFLIIGCQLAEDIKVVKGYIQEIYVNEAELEALIYTKSKETEDKCERMTDTCIDILSNERW